MEIKHPISQKTRDKYRKEVGKMERFVIRKVGLKPVKENGAGLPRKIDTVVKCTEIERYFLSATHAIDRCCHEPVPIFDIIKTNTEFKQGRILRSIPCMVHFKVGKKYRIRIEEVK